MWLCLHATHLCSLGHVLRTPQKSKLWFLIPPFPPQVSAKSIVLFKYVNILFTPVQSSCTIIVVTYRISDHMACVAPGSLLMYVTYCILFCSLITNPLFDS